MVFELILFVLMIVLVMFMMILFVFMMTVNGETLCLAMV